MALVIGAIIGAAVAGGQIAAAGKANKKNRDWAARESQKSRKYHERLAGNAMQRRVADLKLAGLNPILAVGGGGGVGAAAGGSGGGEARAAQQETQGLGALAVNTAKAVEEINQIRVNTRGQDQVNDIRQPATDAANVVNTITGAAKGQKDAHQKIAAFLDRIGNRPAVTSSHDIYPAEGARFHSQKPRRQGKSLKVRRIKDEKQKPSRLYQLRKGLGISR